MLDIAKDNQSELKYYSEIDKIALEALKLKYSWENYNEYDNLQTEFASLFIDPLGGVAFRNNLSEDDLFKKLTKPQKVIYALNAFEGQVNNGGIYQFFWNISEFSLAVEQALKEIHFPELLENYIKVKEEFKEKQAELNKLQRKDLFRRVKYQIKQSLLKIIGKEDKGLRRTGLEDFVSGNTIMKNTEWFNDYFYEIGKTLHQKEAAYILNNIDKIVLVK